MADVKPADTNGADTVAMVESERRDGAVQEVVAKTAGELGVEDGVGRGEGAEGAGREVQEVVKEEVVADVGKVQEVVKEEAVADVGQGREVPEVVKEGQEVVADEELKEDNLRKEENSEANAESGSVIASMEEELGIRDEERTSLLLSENSVL